VSLLYFLTGSDLKKMALHSNVSLYTSSALSWAFCAARIRAKVVQDYDNQDGTTTNVSLSASAIGLQGGVGLCILKGVSSSGWLMMDVGQIG
jgi:hypothetical protein